MKASSGALLIVMGFLCITGAPLAGETNKSVMQKMKASQPITRVESLKTPTPGEKGPFTISRGDADLTLGGRVRVDYYFKDHTYMLNDKIPDLEQFFKETVDLTMAAAYGHEKYGHTAVEIFTDLRHKGIWGKALTYADKDSGPIGPSNIRFNRSNITTIFGQHSHTSGKTLTWFKDAWLKFSLNAAFGARGEDIQYLKMGWFPFDIGRGIALGGYYGLNKELLGLYSYSEDKSAPGINLTGEIIKDRLRYDIYYARFEERGKSLDDVINIEKRYIVGRRTTPWRGVSKDDDLIAGRIKWKALKSDRDGELYFEPYIFYNAASDQKIDIPVDGKTNWGSYGMQIEYSYKNFECGGEFALNYGKEHAYHIDRDQTNITNRDGFLKEEHPKILDHAPSVVGAAPVPVTEYTNQAAREPVYVNGAQIDKAHGASQDYPFYNADDRFRDGYVSKLAGWMAVVDGAYTLTKWDLKLALAYGYASGDDNPHAQAVNKTYHGFVGLHENYSGKQVKSMLVLDERTILRPLIKSANGRVSAGQEIHFSDLQLVGLGLKWMPKTRIKNLSISPNILGFWTTHRIHKYVPNTTDPSRSGRLSTTEYARNFLGTEANVWTSCSVVTDLTFFLNFAVFFPGGFYADMKGVPVDREVFTFVTEENQRGDARMFGLGDDTAYHLNVGIEYKF
ncbi:MAG: hypothetical protein WCW33_06095 [Candidatus Babeliales bacterium]